MRRLSVLAVGLVALAVARSARGAAPEATAVRAARLLDVRAGRIVKDGVVLIEDGRIAAVGSRLAIPPGARVIDLGDVTLMPGLIDAHTHLLSRFADEPNGYVLQLVTKGPAARALDGAADARVTLESGVTTVRDVENEGAGYADVVLRDAITAGLVPGPRMLVATRGIAALGQYHPFAVAPELDLPTGAQMVSGVEEARRAVREQIGHGADLIKVYADWMYPTLTPAELGVIVEEAHRAGRRVAAHATTPGGVRNAILAGVDSIEHGPDADRAMLELMRKKGTVLVATLSVLEGLLTSKNPDEADYARHIVPERRKALALAAKLGVPIALGSDAGTVDSHGKFALEVAAAHRAGLSPLQAIRAATLNAAALLGLATEIGSLEKGRAADMIAVPGDPLTDLATLEHVVFVMKRGVVVKQPSK